MNRIEVTASELENGASKIDSYAEDYMSAANAMKAAAEELASMWEGDSQVAFVEEQEKAYEWYNNMYNICVSYANMMRTAAQEYVRIDQESANAIRG